MCTHTFVCCCVYECLHDRVALHAVCCLPACLSLLPPAALPPNTKHTHPHPNTPKTGQTVQTQYKDVNAALANALLPPTWQG